MPFDYLKKVILKAPEYWNTGSSKSGGLSAHSLGSASGSAGMSEIVSTIFTFKDFFKAFKVTTVIRILIILIDYCEAGFQEQRWHQHEQIFKTDYLASKITWELLSQELAKHRNVQQCHNEQQCSTVYDVFRCGLPVRRLSLFLHQSKKFSTAVATDGEDDVSFEHLLWTFTK